MKALENHLAHLHSTSDPFDVIHDIKNTCFQEVSVEQLGLVCTLLFRSNNSIIKYMEETVRCKEHKLSAKPREQLFTFINELLAFCKKNRFRVDDYSVEILNTCISLFRRDVDNRVRIAALGCMKELIQQEENCGEKFRLSSLTDLLLTEYNCGKCSPAVKNAILELLGAIFRLYPEDVLQRASTVQLIYLDTLDTNFTGKKPNMSQIAAALNGLSSLLLKFSADFSAVPANVQKVYKYLCLALEPPEDLSRYQVPKAGLSFLKEHAEIFKKYLTEDAARMFNRISQLCQHKNKPLSRAAYKAMSEFFIRVAEELCSNARSEEANLETFKFFIRTFIKMMDSQASSSMAEISIALRGIGSFSGAIMRYAGLEELNRQCTKLFEFTERFFSSDFEQLDETAYHLPSFIISFSNMLFFIDTIEEQHIEYLEKQISAVFVFYPQLHASQRARYSYALSRLFTCLFSKGSALNELLSRIVYKVLAFTCTKPIHQDESEGSQAHYEQYISLWKCIIKPLPISDLELPDKKHQEMCKIIYDQVVSNILEMIKKLDIKYTLDAPLVKEDVQDDEDAVLESENIQRLVPSKPKDFEVFFNVVHFTQSILLEYHLSFFKDWVYMYAKDIIQLSNRFPLISGFYKLLTIAMNICEKIDYFDGVEQGNSDNKDMMVCFRIFDKFRKEVEFRIQQYKNELLAACVKFVLSVPKQFINVSLPVNAVQMALKMGLSFIELAHIGLHALESWLRTKPDITKKYLPDVLPLLNDYLTLDAKKYERKVSSRYEKDFHFRQGVNINKKGTGTVLEKSDTMKLQTRILRLLGRLGGDNLYLIPDSRNAIENNYSAISWDHTKRIKFHIPFKGLKPQIFLDGFIPRVADTAENSTDRQSKVAACELLHSILLYMIGTSVYKQSNLTQYYKIYQKLFPSLLRLCTSTEPVAKQLFRPLFFQLIFWFTKNQQYESTDTMTILDSIVDAVGNSDDGALREFSADCLAYFMQCSLESARKNDEESPLNVKSLFKRLYSLAHHPEPYKRVGCALTFNKVYRMFRTAEVIVDQFIFEIQSNLLFSLRLAHKDDPSMKTEQIISSAVRNITRIIVTYAKAGKLIKSNKKRREYDTLSEFVDKEIFPGTNRPEERCRLECMSLFSQLTPYVPGSKSPHAWIQKKLQIESIKWLLDAYEGQRESFSISSPNEAEYAQLLSYYVKIISLVDSYTWMFRESFIDPSILNAGKHKTILFSKLAEFIKYFALADCEIPSESEAMSDENESSTITLGCYQDLSPKEIDIYHYHKTELLLKMFSLFSLLLEKFPEFHMPEDVFELQRFYEILFHTVLAPAWMGFSSSQYLGTESILHTTLQHFCVILETKLPSPKKMIMYETLKGFLKHPRMNLMALTANQKQNKGTVDVQSAVALVDGYKVLHQTKILHPSRFGKFTSSLSVRLFSDLSENCFSYGPSQLFVTRKVFSLCADLHLTNKQVIHCLLNDEVIMDTDSDVIVNPASQTGEEIGAQGATISRTDTLGSVFYHQFVEQISTFLLHNISDCIEEILKHCLAGQSLMWTVLFGILDLTTKQVRPSTELLGALCEHIHILSGSFGESCSHHQKENIVDLCRKMLFLNEDYCTKTNPAGFQFLKNTFLYLTAKEAPLSQKNKGLALLAPLLRSQNSALADVKEAVDHLLVFNFPSQFHDIPKGSTLYSDIQECLEHLMEALSTSHSLLLGQSLLPLLRYEEEHPFTNLLDAQWKIFVTRLPEKVAMEFFAFSMAEFNDASHKNELRLAIAKKLCVPLLHQLSVQSCIQAISPHINHLVNACTSVFTPHLHAPAQNITNLIERTGTFLILRAVFDVLPSKAIKDSLNHIFCPSQSAKKNELTTAIMRAAHSAKAKKIEEDHGIPHAVIREYQCTAYNALASVVICTQTNPSFFNVFFFKENPSKGEFIWDHIVDHAHNFQFEVETHFPSMKSYSEQIRSRQEGKENSSTSQLPKYVSSQYLMDSSLSQDISFLASLYNSQQTTDVQQTTYENFQLPGQQEIPKESSSEEIPAELRKEEDLELDPINENPCMPALLRLVDHIQQQFSHTYKQAQMPEWMKLMHAAFTDSATHPNVMLFLAKVIINRPGIFEPYASEWIEPLLSLAVSSTVSKGFNYYFRDLCITLLLRWPKVTPQGAAQQRLASLMFNQMVSNVIYKTRFIVHCNIDIIKLFVERWKGHFVPSKKLLLDMIACDESRSSSKIQRITGLQILGILVANGLPFYDAVHDKSVSAAQLSTFVSKNLLHNFKEVYCTAAEVCGIVFKQEGTQCDLAKLITTTLNSLYASADSARFLYNLQAIGNHCPVFLDHFFLKIFAMLPKLVGPFRIIALQLITLRAENIDDLFKQMRPVLDKVTTYIDPDAQLLALELFIHIVDDLNGEQALHYIKLLSDTFAAHPSAPCRLKYYRLLMKLYEEKGDLKKDESLRVALLHGFTDSSENIRKEVVSFWSDGKHLSSQVMKRAQQILKLLYSPEVESHWVQSATELLLRLTAQSPDYDLVLFDPLSEDSELFEYQIDHAWSNRSLPMTPLFSTQSQMEMDAEFPPTPAVMPSSQPKGQSASPRASRAVHFTPTMATGDAMDLDTEDSPKTDAEGFQIPSHTPHFAASFSSHTADSQGASLRIPKRFMSQNMHPSQTGNVFMKRAFRKSANKEKYLRAARERRQNQVEIIRTYRKGEHCPPDVQIKSKEIILPLQALIRKDEALGQQFLPTLFHSLLESVTDAPEKAELLAVFQVLIEQIFTQTRGSTSLIASLLQVCYEQAKLTISPKLIYSASLSSFNYHRGILLLEKQILQNETITRSGTSRRSQKSKGEQNTRFSASEQLDDEWMQLIKLYKALQDEDVLLGLYDRLCSTKETKKALEAELRGDYKTALLIYEKALDRLDAEDSQLMKDDTIEFESGIWEQSRLECMNKLLMWDTLAENTEKEVDGEVENVWLPEFRVPFLNYYIESHIKNRNLLDELVEFVDKGLTVSEHKRVLESEFLPHLSLLQICCNEFDRARAYTNQYYTYFLNQWSSVHPLAFVARQSILKDIQVVVEMDEFLRFCSSRANFESKDKLYQFLSGWETRYPSPDSSDIIAWDTVVSNRNRMLEKFYEKYSTENDSVLLQEVKERLVKERGNYYLQMATAARHQNNIAVAEMNLRLSYKSKSSFSFPFFLSVVKLSIIKARQAKSFDKYMKAYAYLEEKKNESSIREHVSNAQKYCMVQAKIFHELAQLVYENPDIAHDTRLLAFKSSSTPSAQLYSKAFRTYEKACKIIAEHYNEAEEHFTADYVASSFVEFALFCDGMLHKLQASEQSNSKIGEKYSHIVVENILQAMKLGSTKARDRFPRLLSLVGSFPAIQELFTRSVKEIPSWMFIRWISQILGILNESEAIATSVVPILSRMAEEYPNALYYPFKISSETFSAFTERLCNPIEQKLSNPLLDEFIVALGKMTHPEHRFKDWAESLKPLVKEKKRDQILAVFHEMSEDLFNPAAPGIGAYNKHFASKWKRPFFSKFGTDGSRLVSMDMKTFLTTIADLVSKMNQVMEPSGTTNMKLSKFSTWLVDYDQSNLPPHQFIEKPGQYTGNQAPCVDAHIKVSSFDSDTLVMGSLRKPKRLKIRGNDQKDYPYLVKGGEDLRLDQRVQQLFSVMNEIFASDSQCTRRHLSLLTYQVVPMTSQVGLIEWIDNTKPLKGLIEDELAKASPKGKETIQSMPAAKKRDQWLRSFSKTSKLCDIYFAMYEKANRKKCIQNVEAEAETIPWDLLRRAVFSLCATPEAYITIRSHFTHSLAAFNTCSYVIGIGDRHLDNFLLNYKDGAVVGIDFGHAFGTATQFLPIPELVPFRLTRQFTNFLRPLQSQGLLNHNMIHCLRALRENKDVLLNTMDVFITEPLLDWEKLARRCATEQGGSKNKSTWFPKEKIRIATKKLEGYNPSNILIEELRGSIHSKKPYIKYLESFAAGVPEDNIRARVGEKCSSVAEQVECLVDLATDPNILGRMYGGWAPWV